MKRAVIFIFLVLSASFFNAEASDFYYHEDFSGYDHNLDGYWETEGDTKIMTENDENILSMHTVSPDVSLAVFTPENAILGGIVTYKIKIKPLQTDKFFGIAYINSTADKACFSLSFSADKTISVYTAGKWENISGYEKGRWYEIKCTLNFDIQRFDIEIDGETKIEDAKFRNTANIKSIKIYSDANDAAAKISSMKLYRKTVKSVGVMSSVEEATLFGGEKNVSPYQQIFYIDFWRDMNPDTLNNETIAIKSIETGEKADYTGSYNSEKRRYTMKMSKAFYKNENYKINISGGENGVCDARGVKMDGSDVKLKFTSLDNVLSVSNFVKNQSVSLENNSNINQKILIITAVYNISELEKAEISEKSIAPNEILNFILSDGKLMVWDADRMIPYTDVLE